MPIRPNVKSGPLDLYALRDQLQSSDARDYALEHRMGETLALMRANVYREQQQRRFRWMIRATVWAVAIAGCLAWWIEIVLLYQSFTP